MTKTYTEKKTLTSNNRVVLVVVVVVVVVVHTVIYGEVAPINVHTVRSR